MQDALYKVVMSGDFAEDRDKDTVIEELAALFKCSASNAAKLIAGKPTPLKKQMNHDTATKYHARLEKVGVKCSIEAISPPPQEPTLSAGLSLEAKDEIKPDSSTLSLEQPAEETSEPDLLSGTSLSLEPKDNATTADEEVEPAQAGSQVEQTIEPGMIVCPKCNVKQAQTKQCSECGIIIEKFLASQAMQPQDVATTEDSQEEDIDDMSELAQFVGDKFDENYRLRFADLNENDGKYVKDWNWAAFLVAFPWMIHRKMYVYAFAFFALTVVLPSFVAFAASITMGLMGTFLYYQFAKKQIGKITTSGSDRDHGIAAKGGVLSIPITIGITLATSFLFMTIFFSIFAGSGVVDMQQGMDNDIASFDKSADEQAVIQITTLKQAINMNIAIMSAVVEDSELPASVEDLQEKFKIPAELFLDKWNTEIKYQKTVTGYSLRSAGPDKAMNTEDDLVLESELGE